MPPSTSSAAQLMSPDSISLVPRLRTGVGEAQLCFADQGRLGKDDSNAKVMPCHAKVRRLPAL